MMKESLGRSLSQPMVPVQQFRQMREQQQTWVTTVDKVSMLFVVLGEFQINRRKSCRVVNSLFSR